MSVGADDIAAPLPQHGSITDLGPHLQMTTTDTLTEVMHQADGSNLCLQVGDKLDVRVLDVIQVHIDIYQHNGVLTLEAHQGLL